MRISVKQLNMFGTLRTDMAIGGCPRMWALHYLDGLRREWLAPQLVDGIKAHACFESLHRDGIMPKPQELQPGVVLTPEDVRPEGHFGRVARAALVHVPVREYGQWEHEHEGFFEWTTTKGVTVEIDLRPDLMSVIEPGLLAYLIDLKTTGNKRNALTDDKGKKPLRDDVQANVYSHGLHLLGAGSTLARWIYVDRNTYASWPVERWFEPKKTEAWLHDNIDATVELIHLFREHGALTALDLPGDENACGGTARFCDHGFEHCLGPVGAKASRLITLEEITRYIGRTE